MLPWSPEDGMFTRHFAAVLLHDTTDADEKLLSHPARD
jgi:hypothetical protein